MKYLCSTTKFMLADHGMQRDGGSLRSFIKSVLHYLNALRAAWFLPLYRGKDFDPKFPFYAASLVKNSLNTAAVDFTANLSTTFFSHLSRTKGRTCSSNVSIESKRIVFSFLKGILSFLKVASLQATLANYCEEREKLVEQGEWQ